MIGSLRLLLGALMLPIAAPALAAGCVDHQRDMASAYAANDADRAASIVRAASTDCQGASLDAIGRNAALIHIRKSSEPLISPGEKQNLVSTALTLGRPWQALATAADIAMVDRRHADAARLFQEALDDIRNERVNPTAPPREVIAKLVKKAEAASLLAREYITRVDRSGAPGGLACTTFRGFTVRRTAIPVEFHYNEPGDKKQGFDAFTDKGRAAANDLVDFLTRQGAPAIHLVGHTDPKGGDEFNQMLSERRAAAVKAFLLSKSYTGQIRVTGRGRSEPFEADDSGAYSEPERHQMDRRVELDRQGSALCAAPG